MDISVQNSTGFINADRLYQQQRSQNTALPNGEKPNFLQTLAEKEDQLQVGPAREAILSLPEQATLHVLFGSEKPDDSGFYGKNNASQIYKGHLLDVAG